MFTNCTHFPTDFHQIQVDVMRKRQEGYNAAQLRGLGNIHNEVIGASNPLIPLGGGRAPSLTGLPENLWSIAA